MTAKRLSLSVVVVLALIVATWFYYRYQQAHPSTADAYLDMHVARIASQVSGPVEAVLVRSHQAVHAGDPLLRIDAKPFALAVRRAEAQLQQAKDAADAADAQVAAAKAQMDAAQATLEEVQSHSARILNLATNGTVSKDQRDAATQALKTARENLASEKANLAAAMARRGAIGDKNAVVKVAEAALDQARLDLQHTQLTAPADGVIGDVDLRPGSYVDAGRPLFALVETKDVWVDANFKETDLVNIQPGQPAQVSVDLMPDSTFHGRVESLSPASGTAFSLLPPENATGNWVKVTQRFPVRVRILDPVPGLRVGASSDVTIDTVTNRN